MKIFELITPKKQMYVEVPDEIMLFVSVVFLVIAIVLTVRWLL